MRPDARSVSFTWHSGLQGSENAATNHSVRRRIQDRFENNHSVPTPFKSERTLRSTITNFTFPSVGLQPRQAIRDGAEKLTKTFREVKITFGTLSQKLRRSTRRRMPLKNDTSPCTPSNTPRSRSRQLLGRTPTKLYSPFNIESPIHSFRDRNYGCHHQSLRRTPLRSCKNTSVDSKVGGDARSRHTLFLRNQSPRSRNHHP
ncbi:uncharacterized protein LOC124155363 [Ischnura elegans]|uniref:uncharacterized protein LOC124155363 n=1 Tax=Ischnura elegans TaxID=197161 RepID=UPI001ED86A11|nr:uncharacterized protein LOC124155363 [Ischnura elegans]